MKMHFYLKDREQIYTVRLGCSEGPKGQSLPFSPENCAVNGVHGHTTALGTLACRLLNFDRFYVKMFALGPLCFRRGTLKTEKGW